MFIRFHTQNHKIRHAELVSASNNRNDQILKQVQGDTC